MPDFPIVDAHLHLWDPAKLRYPWLDDIPLLDKPYLLPDYRRHTEGVEIDKMVFVQCESLPSQCEDEAAWITQLAAEDLRIRGIVPWAPLELGDGVKPVLDRYAENPLIKGTRRIIQFEPAPDFCLQHDFIHGVRLLADYDFAFDICVSYHQLAQVTLLVAQCPNVRFVLDHIGKPDIAGGEMERWCAQIESLGAFENVHCKLSGLVTEADHLQWSKEDLKPYVDVVLQVFGANRILFGGDWPVVCQAASYRRWVDTLDGLLAGLPQGDRVKIFHTNACRFYQLS